MDNPILATKLTIPRRQPSLLERPRLLDLMSLSGETTLTLVSAAAGSGKTTLVADWAHSQDDGSVAWLSLEPDDDRFDRFWTYVIAALQTVAVDVGAGALPLLGRSPTPAITSLLNDLAVVVDKEVRLVLDDYHVIGSTDIHESLAQFLDHLPEDVRVVITTRSDPALPLARWRARGELTEIRVSDLHFTPAETDTYLTDLMGIPLTPDQLSALDERTEGWAAALQLAALSMKGLDDVSGFVSGFAGTERYVVDYLVEEVLDRQPDDVRDFLMLTSILSRLTGPLCDAVTETDGGAAMLERLERDNLLIVPLDSRRQWYRYHHLFADVLEARLRAEYPALALLHRRASDWYDGAGNPGEAIRHALAAGDHDHAADLVEMAVPALRRSRHEATMLTWFDALPAEVFTNRPVLSVGYVGALLASGRTDRVDGLLDGAERWVDADPSQFVTANQDELGRLPSAVALYRSGLAMMTGDVDTAVTHATRAFDLAGPSQPLESGGAAGLLALTHWSQGNLDAAFDRWASAVDSLGRAGHHSDMAGCSISMADIRITQGRLSDAMAIHEQGLASASGDGEMLRGAADMHVGMGEISRERNDLDSARSHLQKAKELGDGNGLPQNLYRSRLLEARICEAAGDLNRALDLVAEAKQVYFTDFSPDVRPMAAVEARMLLRAGRLSDARRWAEQSGLSVDDDPGYLSEFSHTTLARVLTEDGQDVIGFLERLLVSAETGGRTANVIDILIATALALDDTERAIATLSRAVSLAEPERFTRVFLDDKAVAPLLRQVAESDDAPAYARMLSGLTNRDIVDQGLIDPLSGRELEVLRLLGTEMSGPDIARELYVSLNTMRSHTKSIYLKLGVGNRRAAVRRAGELGLI